MMVGACKFIVKFTTLTAFWSFPNNEVYIEEQVCVEVNVHVRRVVDVPLLPVYMVSQCTKCVHDDATDNVHGDGHCEDAEVEVKGLPRVVIHILRASKFSTSSARLVTWVAPLR